MGKGKNKSKPKVILMSDEEENERSSSSSSVSSSSSSTSDPPVSSGDSKLSKKKATKKEILNDPKQITDACLNFLNILKMNNQNFNEWPENVRLAKRVQCFVPKLVELKNTDNLTVSFYLRSLYDFLKVIILKEIPKCVFQNYSKTLLHHYETNRLATMTEYNTTLLQLMGYYDLSHTTNLTARRLEDIKDIRTGFKTRFRNAIYALNEYHSTSMKLYTSYEEYLVSLQPLMKTMLSQRHYKPLHDPTEVTWIQEDITSMQTMLRSFGDQHIQVFYGPARYRVEGLTEEVSSLRAQVTALQNELADARKNSTSTRWRIPSGTSQASRFCMQYIPAEETATAFYEGILHSRPTLLHGLQDYFVSRSDLFTNWEYLKNHHGQMMVTIAVLKDRQESKPPFESMEMSLGDYLRRCQEDPYFASMHYLQQNELSWTSSSTSSSTSRYHSYQHALSRPSSLFEAVGIVPCAPSDLCPRIDRGSIHSPTWYLNTSKGIKTSLHYDRSSLRYTYQSYDDEDELVDEEVQEAALEENETAETRTATRAQRMHLRQIEEDPGKHNLFFQVSGSRVFVLFPPQYTPSLLPSAGSYHGHVSASTTFLHTVSEYATDVEEQVKYILHSPYPSLAEPWRHRVEMTLHAGDAILIPAKWWHYTHLTAPGVGLNWWFQKDCVVAATDVE